MWMAWCLIGFQHVTVLGNVEFHQNLFLSPMDYLQERTVHWCMPDVSLENEITDLDFIDDIAVLAEIS